MVAAKAQRNAPARRAGHAAGARAAAPRQRPDPARHAASSRLAGPVDQRRAAASMSRTAAPKANSEALLREGFLLSRTAAPKANTEVRSTEVS
jgi:hypothetical protein